MTRDALSSLMTVFAERTTDRDATVETSSEIRHRITGQQDDVLDRTARISSKAKQVLRRIRDEDQTRQAFAPKQAPCLPRQRLVDAVMAGQPADVHRRLPRLASQGRSAVITVPCTADDRSSVSRWHQAHGRTMDGTKAAVEKAHKGRLIVACGSATVEDSCSARLRLHAHDVPTAGGEFSADQGERTSPLPDDKSLAHAPRPVILTARSADVVDRLSTDVRRSSRPAAHAGEMPGPPTLEDAASRHARMRDESRRSRRSLYDTLLIALLRRSRRFQQQRTLVDVDPDRSGAFSAVALSSTPRQKGAERQSRKSRVSLDRLARGTICRVPNGLLDGSTSITE